MPVLYCWMLDWECKRYNFINVSRTLQNDVVWRWFGSIQISSRAQPSLGTEEKVHDETSSSLQFIRLGRTGSNFRQYRVPGLHLSSGHHEAGQVQLMCDVRWLWCIQSDCRALSRSSGGLSSWEEGQVTENFVLRELCCQLSCQQGLLSLAGWSVELIIRL